MALHHHSVQIPSLNKSTNRMDISIEIEAICYVATEMQLEKTAQAIEFKNFKK